MFATRIEATYDGMPTGGYEKGKRYVLLVRNNEIRRTDHSGRVPFESMENFFWLWKDIKVLSNVYIPQVLEDL